MLGHRSTSSRGDLLVRHGDPSAQLKVVEVPLRVYCRRVTDADASHPVHRRPAVASQVAWREVWGDPGKAAR